MIENWTPGLSDEDNFEQLIDALGKGDYHAHDMLGSAIAYDSWPEHFENKIAINVAEAIKNDDATALGGWLLLYAREWLTDCMEKL